MRLTHFQLDPDTLSTPYAHSMPFLIDLTMIDLDFYGRLHDYLECPKLKSLKLGRVAFHPLNDDEEGVTSFEIPLSSAIRFNSFPDLEYLSVLDTELDKFPTALRYCPLLQHLNMEWYTMQDSTPSFINSIARDDTFPSLKSLCIQGSVEELEAGEGFAEYCASMRSGLVVSLGDTIFQRHS
jgi:hypothetical protein